MPNKLAAPIMALALIVASAQPAHAVPRPSPAPRSSARLDAFGMASVGLHRLGAYLEAIEHAREQEWTDAYNASQAQASAARQAPSSTTYSTGSTTATGDCGGDLPPCWIMQRESGGNIRAQNPSSSASGKWQILDSTWGGYGGYAHAKDAPEAVQDAKARSMGLCNWQPPNYCAG